MVNFNFSDRPDNQRFKTMLSAYPNITTPELVELFIDFQWTYREMLHTYDQLLSEYQLSESKFILLMFLKQAPDQQLTPSELASKLGATRATVTKLLNAMETSTWVKKQPDPSDLRGVKIQLLPAGIAILDQFLPINFHGTQTFFADFTNSEIQEFQRLLHKIQTNTDKLKKEMES